MTEGCRAERRRRRGEGRWRKRNHGLTELTEGRNLEFRVTGFMRRVRKGKLDFDRETVVGWWREIQIKHNDRVGPAQKNKIQINSLSRRM